MAEDAFKIAGLAPSYAHLMLLLIEEPGLSQNNLSERMNLKASTMTRFIDKLMQKGYVERVQEGRSVFIYPTESGKELKKSINQALKNLFNNYCEVMGKEFAIQLTEDIHKANSILKE
jgi:DNA-binding MarR family transcriptional regulator